MSTATPNRSAASQPNDISKGSAFQGVTKYHWLVFFVAAAGWLFDCMGQRIFNMARQASITELLGPGAADTDIKLWGSRATSVLLIGWGTGGILFGMMSDRKGRVKTIVATLLAYTVFSGLTGLAHNQWDFLFYRFLAGLGIGGMFGAATTFLAESVPNRVRPMALGAMQALSAIGNIAGSLLCLYVPPGKADVFHGYSGWRVIFFLGALPAVLAIVIPWLVHEPEPWVEAKKRAALPSGLKVGSMRELFSTPRWRKNLLVGIGLGFAGMAGLWGIGWYSPELVSTALKGNPPEMVNHVKSTATALQDVGCFFGMLAFTWAASFFGRRVAFLAGFIMALVSTIFVFNSLRVANDAYWMLPLMGFCQLSVFGGYSIYFPEIFPTRLRGTGISLCYNAVRYLTACSTLLIGLLNLYLTNKGVHEPFRIAATIMSLVFLIGPIALIWAPETKGHALPEG